jgi:N,N'-diacetyllegionaminate synthase
MRIGNFEIGKGKVFIIGEMGVNHDGSLEKAKLLVDVAVEGGVDAVKTQVWKTEALMVKDHPDFEMAKKLELSHDELIELKNYCDQKGILFLATPDEEESLDFLTDILKVEAIKVGSGELNNLPFLRRIAAKNLPIILSTGMGDMKEVDEAVMAIVQSNLETCKDDLQLVLLHCTSSYPCPLDQVNLAVIPTLKNQFAKIVGFSDHTNGCLASFGAVLIGSKILEKHYTLDKEDDGPDHKASLNPGELAEYVSYIRQAEKLLGSSVKKTTPSESANKVMCRKCIRAARDLKAGETLKEEDLCYKRPATGLSPSWRKWLVGCVLRKDIEKDQVILDDAKVSRWRRDE